MVYSPIVHGQTLGQVVSTNGVVLDRTHVGYCQDLATFHSSLSSSTFFASNRSFIVIISWLSLYNIINGDKICRKCVFVMDVIKDPTITMSTITTQKNLYKKYILTSFKSQAIERQVNLQELISYANKICHDIKTGKCYSWPQYIDIIWDNQSCITSLQNIVRILTLSRSNI